MPKYTDSEIVSAVASSDSIAQVLRKIGLSPVGGNYVTIKSAIARLKLGTKHFLGQGNTRGKAHNKGLPLDHYLRNGISSNSNQLRKKIISVGIKNHKCESCGLEYWLDKIIPLELHHIDGDRNNNSIENLMVLCPNCHTQTETYKGKNVRKWRNGSRISLKN